MPNFNKVILIGRLTQDPEMKTVGSSQLTTFTLAVNNPYKDKEGEWQEDTTFVDVECWGELANRAVKIDKGQEVLIEGQLRQSRWENEKGEKRSKLFVRASSIKVFKKFKKEQEEQNEGLELDF